ncbi:unnamed protein product [Clonostachys rhizophaga]|uniref:Survival factor 1 n=1 Tax=Clonostachys rhizophaga TaxID=160324 RepID=A0A9N9YAX6_9HYPO|nr:unnamed protein product [Clonostachys rhizophaga]
MFQWAKQQLANVAGTQEPIWGPSAIKPVSEEDAPGGYTELSRDSLTWKELDYTNVESQTFYFVADSGRLAWVQVLYSNVIGIAISGHLNIKIYSQDPSKPHFWSSLPINDIRFSEDKTAIYAEGLSIELSENGKSYRIKTSVSEGTAVDLTVTRVSPGFHVGKDGTTLYGTDLENPWGSMRHAYWPRCVAEGTITIADEGPVDFHGQSMFVYALQGMKPHHAAGKWNFAYFQGPSHSAVMMEFTTPPSYGSTVVNVGGITKGDTILFAGSNNAVGHVKTEQDPDNDWPEPTRVSFTWKGKDNDGNQVEASLEEDLGTRLDRIDIMAELPAFVKSILATAVGLKPYCYQYATKASLRIKVGDQEIVEEGQLMTEATFICM